MRHLADWACQDTGVIVVLSPSVLKILTSYIQDEDKLEAGGILLGYRRGDHFEIINATEPTQFDTRSRYHFERAPEIHTLTATELWNESKGHVSYIGEWHTHPEENPTPSMTDLKEWGKLTNGLPNKNALVVLIVGTREIWIGLSNPNGSISKLTPVT